MSRIPQECKRLAEVDFPIAVVSRHAAREKSIRHGHPSTLHLWWARRPLAACRAMLMALLLPDPADEHCPKDFRKDARRILLAHPGVTERLQKEVDSDEGLRAALLRFIGDFANWDVAADGDYLRTARALVKAAHGDEAPLVVDPFAGGGSIPLEALRIGCDAFASDLNPVACLILKTMLEDIPRHGPGLADELRKVGAEIKQKAEKELKPFYPDDADGSTPIAYLWARTVQCEAPHCGAEIPLVRSFWLSKKAKRRRALKPIVTKGPKGRAPTISFEVFTPKSESDAPVGTVSNAKAKCLACGSVLAPGRVRTQLCAQRAGADVVFDSKGNRKGGAFLLAVVTRHDAKEGRQWRVATDDDYRAVFKASKALGARKTHTNFVTLNPTRPSPNARGVTAPTRYGAKTFADLFSARQKLVLGVLRDNVELHVASEQILVNLLFLAVGRCSDQSSAHVSWISGIEAIGHTFPRQAIQMVWDFVESVPIGTESANFLAAVEWIVKVVKQLESAHIGIGSVSQADASDLPLPSDSVSLLFTDPPYYDSVPYGNPSEFFFAWLSNAPGCGNFKKFLAPKEIVPKERECVWNAAHVVGGEAKNATFFERKVSKCLAEARRVVDPGSVACVVFAHKSTEGWEAILAGMISGGWMIEASWPIATERAVRTNAQNTASLATSIHLVCRPRSADAPAEEWSRVRSQLQERVGGWMERLDSEGIRGADLVFACIGPAIEVYSRYSKVEDAEGREIPLGGNPEASRPHERGFLAYVWEFVGRAALNQVLGTGKTRPTDTAGAGLEEDARLTALFLWTLQSTATDDTDKGRDIRAADDADDTDQAATEDDDEDEGGKPRKGKKGLTLQYDVARRFAQPLGIHLDQWENRIIETDKGVVRLLPVSERAEQLWGEKGADAVAGTIESAARRGAQQSFDFIFDEPAQAPAIKTKGRKRALVSDEDLVTRQSATTLDRVHAAMLLQSAGRATALRAFLKSETERGPEFLRLANALSALYPKESDEKRLLDAMLLAVPK